MRFYTLESSVKAWQAELRVYGFKEGRLREFRPHDLTYENVRLAYADNRHSKSIYNFDSACESICYNAILDSTPLPGLWPWPKASEKAAE